MLKLYKNVAEEQFAAFMRREGWGITKKGWPDFVCWKNGEVIVVEVKPKKDEDLSRPQYMVMKALAKQGFKCYRWSPDSSMTELHFP